MLKTTTILSCVCLYLTTANCNALAGNSIRYTTISECALSSSARSRCGCSVWIRGLAKRYRHNDIPIKTKCRESKVEEIYRIIATCPNWDKLGRDMKDSDRHIIMENLRLLTKFRLDDIRSAYIQFLKADEDNMTQLYLINRYIFAVPEWGKSVTKDGRFIAGGGFVDRPTRGKWSQGGWLLTFPFTINSLGDPVLSYDFHGFMGPAVSVMSEFDYFRKHFGRRKFSSHNSVS